MRVFKTQEFRFLLYGGAVGGGKSILEIGIIHQLAMDYPNTRWAIVRKNLKTLKRTSIPSFKKVVEINEDEGQFIMNYSDYTVKYNNGSEVIFVEADQSKDRDFDKLKGLEVTGGLIEEVNEIAEQAFSILKTRIGRWNNEKYKIRPFILMNCNPAKNWVKTIFYDPWIDGNLKAPYYYLPAFPTDNPHNSQDYLDMLNSLPETERQRFMLGNWEYSDDPNQLISYIAIKDVFNNDSFDDLINTPSNANKIYLGVDVARYGDDRTVLCYIVGNVLCKFEEFRKKGNTEVARIVADRVRLYKILSENISVDTVGLGGGVLDALVDLGIYANDFIAGSSATEFGPNPYSKYGNKRDESHWQLREDILAKEVEAINNVEFIKEATNINYNITEKVLKIESKDSFKKRMGFSPDYLDSAVIANHTRRNSLTRTSFVNLSAMQKTKTRTRKVEF